MESILQSIKKLLGDCSCGESPFDTDIIIQINMAFSTLNQLGVGPSSGFAIEGEQDQWDDFSIDTSLIGFVKTYVYLKTRLVFDPPSSSFVLASIEKQISELEWRITNHRSIADSNGGATCS